jgi:hypothetical protein
MYGCGGAGGIFGLSAHFIVKPMRASQFDLISGCFFCFGCRVGGDVFTFEMLRTHCTFPEAIRRVALFAGLNPQSPSLLWRLGEQVISRVEGPRVGKFFASPPKAGERRRRSRLPAGAARARMIGRRKLACLLPRRIVPVGNLPPVSCAADAADCESRSGGSRPLLVNKQVTGRKMDN